MTTPEHPSALAQLALLLHPATQEGARTMPASNAIDKLIADMEARSKGRKTGQLAEDQQVEAVRRFWDSQEMRSFRDTYLLSWSLCLPHRNQGPCILEDRPRLQRVLDGVDDWQGKPGAYRRCYQGLVKSFFTFDALLDEVSGATRNNWRLLRDYLADRNGLIKDKQNSPVWVDVAIEHRHIFGESPCEPYVEALLRGDSGVIDHLCEHLGINKASWFLRELVLAQVNGATELGNAQFQQLLPRLIELLAANEVLRDRGMVAVLDRYAQVPGTPLHPTLRDHTIGWWGNPWLPSNETRWGGVQPAARTMVADWLKLEFIETFFTKLAEDGLADPRRMNFWKRYVKAIDHIEFALGSVARNSRERDMVVLRKKMTGLVHALDTAGTNNAFIMHMGPLVAVEFSGLGNAFYGYDARKTVPFDTSQMLRLEVDARNSLKSKAHRILWMSHQDNIHGWDKWEAMFEATLRKEFNLKPSAAQQGPRRVIAAPLSPPPAPPAPQAPAPASRTSAPAPRAHAPAPAPASADNPWGALVTAPQLYSRAALDKFARENGLVIDDKTKDNGNLWVRTDGGNAVVNRVLTRWGFVNKPGKGWWK
jgi:hypothetical protein